MTDIGNAAIAGASAGAVLGLGWIGVLSVALLNAAIAARRREAAEEIGRAALGETKREG